MNDKKVYETEVFPIVVDQRERASLVPEALTRLEVFELSFECLKVGDYRVADRLLFERKTLSDFGTSITDGRLFRQARQLAGSATPHVLILEGTSADLTASGMSRESIQGALISVSLVFGIPVLRSIDPEETARLILYATRQFWGQTRRGIHRGATVLGGRKRAQMALLQGLPRVGPVRALALLEEFGSIQALCGASTEELCRARGIGAHTANLIRWVVGPGSAQTA
jgi:ERCC4-type nuclease